MNARHLFKFLGLFLVIMSSLPVFADSGSSQNSNPPENKSIILESKGKDPKINGYSFEWDEMTEYPKGYYCSSNGMASIARLMEQLGTESNLNMKYGIEHSYAHLEDVPRSLNHFGYYNGGIIIKYDTNQVVAELINGHSIIVSGFRIKKDFNIFGFTLWSSYSGGHAWLCHGLMERRRNKYTYRNGTLVETSTESLWYPLCNWGDDGNDDGYFLSDVFNKSAGPFDTSNDNNEVSNPTGDDGERFYQYNVKAVIGIRK